MEIKEMLDQLANFYAQKDSIAARKKALMDEVKVPTEVLEVQNRTNDAAQKYASAQLRKIDELQLRSMLVKYVG